jgi:membrane-associated phospholipid phosphatase
MRWIIKYDAYFVGIITLIAIGLIYQLNYKQIDAIIVVNQYHESIKDSIFSFCTRLGEEIPYILLIIFFYFKKDYSRLSGIALSCLIVFLGVTVLKEYFKHPRPMFVLNSMGLISAIKPVAGVALVDGFYSFPSGHTSSAFALYGFLAFSYPEKRMLQVLLFFMALSVGFSRIYLSQHFPEDVLIGCILGTFAALLTHKIMDILKKYRDNSNPAQ